MMLNQFPGQQQQIVEPIAGKANFMGHEQAQKHYNSTPFQWPGFNRGQKHA